MKTSMHLDSHTIARLEKAQENIENNNAVLSNVRLAKQHCNFCSDHKAHQPPTFWDAYWNHSLIDTKKRLCWDILWLNKTLDSQKRDCPGWVHTQECTFRL